MNRVSYLTTRHLIGRSLISDVVRRLSSTYSIKSDSNGVAILQLSNLPVNAMSSSATKEWTDAIKAIECDGHRGLIITSAKSGIFSAGLDLAEVASLRDPHQHWTNTRQFFMAVYTSPLITIAAMNGHAIAGGAVVACCCDYRFALKGSKIGLNELVVGVPIPFWVHDIVAQVIGEPMAVRLGREGPIVSAEEACKVHLVDQVLDSDEEIMKIANEKMKQCLKLPDEARRATKSSIVKRIHEEYLRRTDEHMRTMVDALKGPECQDLVRAQLKKSK